MRKLMTIEEAFQVGDRVVVLPHFAYGTGRPAHDDAAELRCPDGAVVRVRLVLAVEWGSRTLQAIDAGVPLVVRVCLLTGVARADVPARSELWCREDLVEDALAGSTETALADAVHLPSGWIRVTSDIAARLEAELQRELCAGHELHGRMLRAIARREDCDDVLFAAADGAVFDVHLTWSGEKDPQWPATATYASLADFVQRWLRESS